MAENKVFHLLTDETGQEILGAINDLVAAHGGTPSQVGTAIEYGVRKVKGASSPTYERVTRVGGVISAWDITYTPNIGDAIAENPFERISLFSPPLFTDKAGNAFRRYKRFYYGTETIGNYEYTWVCERQLYGWYKLPKAFYRKGVPYWNYVDRPVYEGSFETVGGVNYLCSKPGKNPVHNITRTVAYNAAKAWHTRLNIDTDKEEYLVTTMSEITEILQPLLLIMFGSTNSQAFYAGHNSSYGSGTYTVTSYDASTKRVNISGYPGARVGARFEGNDTWGNDANYRNIVEVGDGYFIHDGDAFTSLTKVSSRPTLTGETDVIPAMCGTLANDDKHSFKVMGQENIYGNQWKHILDCTILDYVPYVCDDLSLWTDTSDPAGNAAFKKCAYEVAKSGGYATALGHDESYPDIKLTTAVGGSTSTWYCDYYWINGGARTVLYGGSLIHGADGGAWCWYLVSAVGDSYWSLGAPVSHRSL